jgi:hypothetical protein
MLKYNQQLLLYVLVLVLILIIALMMENTNSPQLETAKHLIAVQLHQTQSFQNPIYQTQNEHTHFDRFIDQNLSKICQQIDFDQQIDAEKYDLTQKQTNSVLFVIDPVDLDLSIFFQAHLKKIVLILDQNLSIHSRNLLQSIRFKIDESKHESKQQRSIFQPAIFHQSSVLDQNLLSKWQVSTDFSSSETNMDSLPLLINTFDPLWFDLQKGMIPNWSFDAQHPWIFEYPLPTVDVVVIADADLFKNEFYQAIDSLAHPKLFKQYDLLLRRSLDLGDQEKFKNCLLQIKPQLSTQIPTYQYPIISAVLIEIWPNFENFLIWKSKQIEPFFEKIVDYSIFENPSIKHNLTLFFIFFFILSLLFKFWMGNHHV